MEFASLNEIARCTLVASDNGSDWCALYGSDGSLLDAGHLSDVMERIVDSLPLNRVWHDAVFEGARERDDRTPKTFKEFETRAADREAMAAELAKAEARVAELRAKLI